MWPRNSFDRSEHLVRADQERRRVRLGRPRQQLLGELQEDAQVAADRVVERERPTSPGRAAAGPELVAEGAGARVDALDFRRGPALDGAQREPEDHLEPELEAVALRARRDAARPPCSPRRRSDTASRSAMSADRVLRGLEEPAAALARVARRLEQHRELATRSRDARSP